MSPAPWIGLALWATAVLHAGENILTGTVGNPVTTASCFGGTNELVYYVWDTGDGRWIPGARGMGTVPAPSELVWSKPGEYQTRWTVITLSGRSRSEEGPLVRIVGEEKAPEKRLDIKSLSGMGGTPLPSGPFMSHDPYAQGAVELVFGGLRRIDWLVLHSAAGGNFPENFSIHTSADGGTRWHPVMSADFVAFPNPGTNTVWIPLRGIAADAVRVFVPRGNGTDGKYSWEMGKIEAYGGGEFPWAINGASNADIQSWNNLWLNFGLAANEVHERFDPWWQTERPLDGGMRAMGSTAWHYWDALKLGWLGKNADLSKLESFFATVDAGPDGFVWAAPGHEKHLDHSRHYTTNASYIRAVAHDFLMRRDPAILEAKDPKTGQTVLEKVRNAMRYQLENLHGKEGLLVMDDPERDGTATSLGGNYWDFWLFGYKSAYENAVFYDSLRMMAELEEALGNGDRAKELRDMRSRVWKRFNETFWDGEKGRYIGWEDIRGKRYDYGFTDVNLQALALGLADANRAEQVLSWLDGTRRIGSDDAHDIYHFGFAPRSNTVDAVHGDPKMVNTWNGELDVSPGGTAAFGEQIQNGGTIFMTSYHDLHARRAWRGPEDVLSRWRGIANEFGKDQLRRDPDNFRGQSDVVGILREFPESGLVPYFFIDGILGLEPVAGGLRIEPSFPEQWPTATVNHFDFAGKDYSITADRSAPTAKIDGRTVVVPADGAYLLSPDGKLIPQERVIPSKGPAKNSATPPEAASLPSPSHVGSKETPDPTTRERTVYYETFQDGARDYSRILRTAFAARKWEITSDKDGIAPRNLNVRCLFDRPEQDGLLIFDIPPVHITGFRLKARNPESNKIPVSISASFGITDGRAVVFEDCILPADGRWHNLEGEISKGFKNVIAAGKALPKEAFDTAERRDMAVNKLFFKFRLPPGLPAEGREFIFDVNLLETFAR